jgi:serpin B
MKTLLLVAFLCVTTIHSSVAQSEFSKPLNAFTLQLLEKRLKAGDNHFGSGLSAAGAFALLYEGADGNTKKLLEKIFGFDELKTGPWFAELNRDFKAKAKAHQYQLYLANAVWTRTPLSNAYIQRIKTNYGGNIYPLTNEKPINDWAERQTNKRIKDLLPPGTIDEMTRMVLTNALYFKADWKFKFDSLNTQKQADFYLSNGNKSKATLMYQKNYFLYQKHDDFAVLEMPYRGEQISFVAILPDKGKTVAKITAQLAKNPELIYPRGQDEVMVFLPKFKMETGGSIKRALTDLGMAEIFERVNLARMTESREGFQVSDVIQKAFVEVNEAGTEAAAVTAIIIRAESSIDRHEKQPTIFRADRPFLFLIVDKSSGLVLFDGVVEKP